jgi:diacylglycerol kinase (ATP)
VTRAVETLEREGIRVRQLPTSGPGAATALARDAVKDDIDLVLVAGGDGTINEVINGMVNSHVPLAILPAGTANVLAVELGIGTKIEPAARLIKQCVPERIALGRVHTNLGSRYFGLMAGVGLDAHIVYTVNAKLKATLGKGAYWIGGFSQALRLVPQFDVVINGERRCCGFALASRVRNYGGDLTLAANASLLESDFETVLFEGRNPLKYAFYLLGALAGALESFRGIHVDRSRVIEIPEARDRRIYVQVDGEYAGHLPARIEIVEDALTLLMPTDARTRLALKVSEAMLPAAG